MHLRDPDAARDLVLREILRKPKGDYLLLALRQYSHGGAHHVAFLEPAEVRVVGDERQAGGVLFVVEGCIERHGVVRRGRELPLAHLVVGEAATRGKLRRHGLAPEPRGQHVPLTRDEQRALLQRARHAAEECWGGWAGGGAACNTPTRLSVRGGRTKGTRGLVGSARALPAREGAGLGRPCAAPASGGFGLTRFSAGGERRPSGVDRVL